MGYAIFAAAINAYSNTVIDRYEAAARVATIRGASTLAEELYKPIYKLMVLLGKKWKPRDAEFFIHDALESVSNMVQVEGARSCLYVLDKIETPTDATKFREVLRHYGYVGGRKDEPRPEFVEDSAHGSVLLKMLRAHDMRLIKDIRDSDVVLDCKNRTYGAFIASSIVWQNESLAVLTIDAPGYNSLGEGHRRIAQLACQFIGAGLHSSNKPMKGPEDIRGALLQHSKPDSQSVAESIRITSPRRRRRQS